MFKQENNKDPKEAASEWDELAPIRHRQTSSGVDVTFSKIFVPTILNLIGTEVSGTLLDVGCGSGVLSSKLASIGFKTTGIDPSSVAIALARENFGDTIANFECASLDTFASQARSRFSVVCANMVIMNVWDLYAFLRNMKRLSDPDASIIISMTHPAFWPRFCGYDKEQWFEYNKEITISGPFKISAEPDIVLRSTHIHRPLSAYLNAISSAGLYVSEFCEPMPMDEDRHLWPYRWEFPRYIFLKLKVA